MLRQLVFLFMALCSTLSVATAQSVVISQPSFTFDFLCQSQGVNEVHTLTFTVTPIANLQSSNQFTLEMSNDNFSTFETLTILGVTQNGSSSLHQMQFTLPQTIYGTGYKLRVKTSAPARTSPLSVAFDAYYMMHNQQIALDTNGATTVSFCAGSSYSLDILNTGNSNSPIFYNDLTYIWYKMNGSNAVEIPGETGSSLTISQPGRYYVETNYGVCSPSSHSRSLIITVNEVVGSSYSISASSSSQTVCVEMPITLSLNTSSSGLTFQWYRDNVAISGANSETYVATDSGAYTVAVDTGGCLYTTDEYALSPETIDASLNIENLYELAIGESLNVAVSTTAEEPEFQWFHNEDLMDITTSNVSLSSSGNYSVVVTQTEGCNTSVELLFVLQEPSVAEVPNIISPNGDGANDTFKIPNRLINEGVKLAILNGSGKTVFETENYQNNWPQSNDEVMKSGAIFYYVISKNSNIIKQGILTVLR